MIRWPLYFLLTAWVLALDAMGRCGPFPVLPDGAACLAAWLGLFARERAVGGLLLAAAVARGPVAAGDPLGQLVVMGLPVLVLLPMRRWFFRGRVAFQAAAGAACVLLMEGAGAGLGLLDGAMVLGGPPDPWRVGATAVAAPLALRLFSLLPPWSHFAEPRAV